MGTTSIGHQRQQLRPCAARVAALALLCVYVASIPSIARADLRMPLVPDAAEVQREEGPLDSTPPATSQVDATPDTITATATPSSEMLDRHHKIATGALHADACGSSRAASDSLIDYDYLVSCTVLRHSRVLAHSVLIAVLVFLLYLLSSTADSFFCPVLQTLVEKYRIPPDIAGVTFLSFGNGSPDVFSNIAAFATSSPRLGVASLLGGGLLVTTVIAASVGLVSQGQDQLIPAMFVRDVAFYMLAVVYFGVVFFDGIVTLAEALGFLIIYAAYVVMVFFGSSRSSVAIQCSEQRPRLQSSMSSPCSSASSTWPETDPISYDVILLTNHQQVSDYQPSSDSERSDTSLTSLLSAPTNLQRWSVQPSPRDVLAAAAAGEKTALLSRQSTLRRPASYCTSMLHPRMRRRRSRSVWEAAKQSAQYERTAKRWTRTYHELDRIAEVEVASGVETSVDLEADELETLAGEPTSNNPSGNVAQPRLTAARWSSLVLDLVHRYVLAPIQFSTTFIRRMSIPLVDEETWDKGFAVMCPPSAIFLVGMTVFQLNPLDNWNFLLTTLLVGGAGSAFVYATASEDSPPEGLLLAPYLCLAFCMSVIWIMNLANEVLGVLEVLGRLCGISSSVLGVSVLAWGNSIGDLVSDTAIARDGFPTMAFAGCFAGPMFNLLVGVGVALTISIARDGPFYIGEPTALVYLGFISLFLSLALNLVGAMADGYQYRPRLCYLLLSLYASFAALSIGIIISTDD